jgi:hypothetical protein
MGMDLACNRFDLPVHYDHDHRELTGAPIVALGFNCRSADLYAVLVANVHVRDLFR